MGVMGWCPTCGKPGPLGEVHRCGGPDPRDARIAELEAQLQHLVDVSTKFAPGPTAARLARAVELLDRWEGRRGGNDDGETIEGVTRAFLAEPPTAGERKHAALVRVAEYAERIEQNARKQTCQRNGVYFYEWSEDRMSNLRDALAELRRARGEG